jgi:hypothetical protein
METKYDNAERPVWLDNAQIVETFDARTMLQSGQHPLQYVINRTAQLQPAQVFELITPFSPMPMIEKMTSSGFHAYVDSSNSTEVHTYFCK